jgi:hypothetical protein
LLLHEGSRNRQRPKLVFLPDAIGCRAKFAE